MAQASTVQREPSMEEILASIRRIIEDSDQVGRKSGDNLKRFDAAQRHDDGAAGEGESRAESGKALAFGVGDESGEPDNAGPGAGNETGSGPGGEAGGEPAGLVQGESAAGGGGYPGFPSSSPTILSEEPARQVGAAFSRLSEAFAASRRRNIDEVAEEMLRPMLRDWLDNNLPRLVERLVREEIERVARSD